MYVGSKQLLTANCSGCGLLFCGFKLIFLILQPLREENMLDPMFADMAPMERMEFLYEKFYRRLFLYAKTFLGDDDESKDVVADVFQMLWEDWGKGDGRYLNPTSSLLYISVRNRCLDVMRRAKVTEHYQEMVQATDSMLTDDDVAEFERRVSSIHEAILALPEPGLSVLRCVYFKQMSYKQTAEHLGISENMVHRNMLKVFRLLREKVGRAELLLWLLISTARLYS